MLSGAKGSEWVARDTVFAAAMIVLNGVVGLLVLGAGKHFEQTFQLQGAASALVSSARPGLRRAGGRRIP